jgi:hypothetical protein
MYLEDSQQLFISDYNMELVYGILGFMIGFVVSFAALIIIRE